MVDMKRNGGREGERKVTEERGTEEGVKGLSSSLLNTQSG